MTTYCRCDLIALAKHLEGLVDADHVTEVIV